MIVIIGMTNVQASTENAEAFDRLNRRLDNEVKNFTAMVKEVSSTSSTSSKSSIINVTKFFIDCEKTLHMYSKFDSHNSSQY